MSVRKVVFDCETTGLHPSEGHRIIEIGAVELIDDKRTGRIYHQYLNPQREIDPGAMAVHGISNEFLKDKPLFSNIVEDLIRFFSGAEIIAHNAPFDVGFINSELALLKKGWGEITDYCEAFDTLHLAKMLHPGQRNTLDAICKRYGVDNSQRESHGALIDSEILVDVYLVMLIKRHEMGLDADGDGVEADSIRRIPDGRSALRVIKASESELVDHNHSLENINKETEGNCLWDTLGS